MKQCLHTLMVSRAAGTKVPLRNSLIKLPQQHYKNLEITFVTSFSSMVSNDKLYQHQQEQNRSQSTAAVKAVTPITEHSIDNDNKEVCFQCEEQKQSTTNYGTHNESKVVKQQKPRLFNLFIDPPPPLFSNNNTLTKVSPTTREIFENNQHKTKSIMAPTANHSLTATGAAQAQQGIEANVAPEFVKEAPPAFSWPEKRVANNLFEVLGNTPMVYLNKVAAGCKGRVAVKMEYYNPACSVKDRMGWAMLLDAEAKGKITPGVTTLIEPSSGNMGIALASAAAARGYPLIVVMPSSVTNERRVLLRAYGATVVLTEPEKALPGCIERAKEIAARLPNSYILQQFSNPLNVQAHYETTGPEIWRQTNGNVDAIVFGVGSGGTLTGAGRYLREKNPKIRIFAAEPEEAAVLSGGTFNVHKIPGMGAGLIPEVLDTNLYEDVIRVHSDEALTMARRMAAEEGILCGVSSGANVAAAMRIANMDGMEGKVVVTALPSFGERYLSSPLYAEVRAECEQMTVESLDESIKRLGLDNL